MSYCIYLVSCHIIHCPDVTFLISLDNLTSLQQNMKNFPYRNSARVRSLRFTDHHRFVFSESTFWQARLIWCKSDLSEILDHMITFLKRLKQVFETHNNEEHMFKSNHVICLLCNREYFVEKNVIRVSKHTSIHPLKSLFLDPDYTWWFTEKTTSFHYLEILYENFRKKKKNILNG